LPPGDKAAHTDADAPVGIFTETKQAKQGGGSPSKLSSSHCKPGHEQYRTNEPLAMAANQLSPFSCSVAVAEANGDHPRGRRSVRNRPGWWDRSRKGRAWRWRATTRN